MSSYWGVSKTRGGAGVGSSLSFFKECCLKVRVRVSLNPNPNRNPNPYPNLNPKTAFFIYKKKWWWCRQ